MRKTRPPATARIWFQPQESPSGQRSASFQVPAAVPSLRQNPRPLSPSNAVNTATSPSEVKFDGDEPATAATGLMSLTRYGSSPKAGADKDTRDSKDNRDSRIPDAAPLLMECPRPPPIARRRSRG